MNNVDSMEFINPGFVIRDTNTEIKYIILDKDLIDYRVKILILNSYEYEITDFPLWYVNSLIDTYGGTSL